MTQPGKRPPASHQPTAALPDQREHQILPPSTKRRITIWLDADIIAWFKRQGPHYQKHMNEVLKHYVAAQERAEAQTGHSQKQ